MSHEVLTKWDGSGIKINLKFKTSPALRALPLQRGNYSPQLLRANSPLGGSTVEDREGGYSPLGGSTVEDREGGSTKNRPHADRDGFLSWGKKLLLLCNPNRKRRSPAKSKSTKRIRTQASRTIICTPKFIIPITQQYPLLIR